MNKERTLTLVAIILAAAASRLLPHPANVTPIAAIALFAGAQFGRRWPAFIVPLAAMLMSDLALGFHSTMLSVYVAFAATVWLGFGLQNRHKAASIAGRMLTGSILFFVVTNMGVWFSGELYPMTIDGLSTCFIAAIPYFSNTLLGDAFYATLLFGGMALAEKKYPVLQAA